LNTVVLNSCYLLVVRYNFVSQMNTSFCTISVWKFNPSTAHLF